MNPTEITVWAVTAVGLAGLGAAFYKSERTSVRLGALAAFSVLYFAVLGWQLADEMWFNVTTAMILLIAFGSRMRKPATTAKPGGGAPVDSKEKTSDD